MSAKIVPIFDDPGFFGGCFIGSDNAPPDIVAAEEPQYDYHAVFKTDLNRVEPEEFLKYARRLTTLCFVIYGRATIDLRADSQDPNGCFNFPAPIDRIPDSVRQIDSRNLNYASFRTIFRRSYSIGLRITQKKPLCSLADRSFALIEWTHLKPEVVFISSHRGQVDNPRTYDGQLDKLLLRKMFYVRGTAPDHRSSVQLGFNVYNEELQER